jgi:hypothetical protein
MEYPCRNPFLVLLPDMAVHALHPGENVQEHGVSVQESFPCVVVKLLGRDTQQIPQI